MEDIRNVVIGGATLAKVHQMWTPKRRQSYGATDCKRPEALVGAALDTVRSGEVRLVFAQADTSGAIVQLVYVASASVVVKTPKKKGRPRGRDRRATTSENSTRTAAC